MKPPPKYPIGTVKFQKGKVWVKVSTDPTPKNGWIYWLNQPRAIELGLTDGCMVAVRKGLPELT